MKTGTENETQGSGQVERLVSRLSLQNEAMREALERISKWFGEFPPSGRTWEDGRPMSYGVAFGSNGERDYMRKVAADALQAANMRGERPLTT